MIEGSCLASVGNLVDDILSVKQSLDFCQFSFIKNMCNKATMGLATEALSSISTQVWLEDYPACIDNFVQFDSLIQ